MARSIKIPQFSALIFDLDGLVLDTETTYFTAWKQAATTMGFELTDTFCASLSGLHFQQLEKNLIDHCGADFDLSEFNHLSGQYWRQTVEDQGIPVKKGFFSLLEQLRSKDIPFCLATNSHHQNAMECLELAGLGQVFSNIIGRDQVSQGKPAPDVFFAAAKALLMPIKQCCVLEDSMIGVQAAISSGAISVFIPSIYPVNSTAIEMTDFIYDDLGQFAEIIKNNHGLNTSSIQT